ncbi:GAF domain-containing protein [Brevibacterium aurantiacum]|uniref:GAF domain-containing protein n=1 Tax=Brevibacterium aurantiacum TaxID=273384 RepID=A0A2H1KXD2_BREAU|nr:helix-turn-helix domain-containing protein [Brevibacterium aurantiacum]SMY04341.1 GAF domain-containing protein [Brevibacterium aurantiacum]
MTAAWERLLSSLLAANTPAQAMQAAVGYVSEALRCDISWTGIVESDDQLHMGAHHGLTTPEMSTVWRLAVGEGIGGRAVSLGRTQRSSNYLHDSRRVPAKRLIDNESIATVLVSPLTAAGQPTGVLYAAHRELREWSPQDVDHLETTAHRLSMRLQQLTLLRQTERTVRSLQRKAVGVESALQSSSEFIEALTNTGEIDSALEVAAVFLNANIEIHDSRGRTLHTAGPDEVGCAGTRLTCELGNRSALSLRIHQVDMEPSPADTPIRLAIGALRLQLLRLGERAEAREELRGELLESLLTGRFNDSEHLRRRLSLISRPNLAESARVIVIEPLVASSRLSAQFHADLRTTFPQLLIDHRDSSLVIVVEDHRPEKHLIRQLRELLNREKERHRRPGTDGAEHAGPRFIAGVGRRSRRPHEISVSYDEAAAACAIGISDPRADNTGIFSARKLGLQGLASMPQEQLTAMVNDTFGPIIDHDQRRGTDFMRTVRTYLANDRHLGDTASELHLHYNTVRNRIARIEELLDLKFDQAEGRYRAETAIRMVAVLTTLTEQKLLTVRL